MPRCCLVFVAALLCATVSPAFSQCGYITKEDCETNGNCQCGWLECGSYQNGSFVNQYSYCSSGSDYGPYYSCPTSYPASKWLYGCTSCSSIKDPLSCLNSSLYGKCSCAWQSCSKYQTEGDLITSSNELWSFCGQLSSYSVSNDSCGYQAPGKTGSQLVVSGEQCSVETTCRYKNFEECNRCLGGCVWVYAYDQSPESGICVSNQDSIASVTSGSWKTGKVVTKFCINGRIHPTEPPTPTPTPFPALDKRELGPYGTETMDDCSSYFSEDSCVTDPSCNCGWLQCGYKDDHQFIPELSSCVEGTSSGPDSGCDDSLYPATEWSYQCTPCTDYGSEEDCLQESSSCTCAWVDCGGVVNNTFISHKASCQNIGTAGEICQTKDTTVRISNKCPALYATCDGLNFSQCESINNDYYSSICTWVECGNLHANGTFTAEAPYGVCVSSTSNFASLQYGCPRNSGPDKRVTTFNFQIGYDTSSFSNGNFPFAIVFGSIGGGLALLLLLVIILLILRHHRHKRRVAQDVVPYVYQGPAYQSYEYIASPPAPNEKAAARETLAPGALPHESSPSIPSGSAAEQTPLMADSQNQRYVAYPVPSAPPAPPPPPPTMPSNKY